jgi:tetratricopeptide (TPR) repeat protein
MRYDDTTHRRLSLVLFLGIVVHILFVLVSAVPETRPSFWGFHAWTYLPGNVAVGVALGALCVGALVYIAPRFPLRPRGILAFSLLWGLLCFIFRDRAHLLGDGRLWISTLAGEPTLHPHEPLSFAALTLATRDVAGAGPDAIALRLEIAGVVLGVLAMALILLVVGQFGTDRRSRWLVFGLVGGSGVIQFGFGYVEAYPFLWVWTLLFFALGLQAIRLRLAPWWSALAAGLAAGSHINGVLLYPALIAILIGGRRPVLSWMTCALAGAVPLAFSYLVLPAIVSSGLFGEGGVTENAARVGKTLVQLGSGQESFKAWLFRQVNLWGLILPAGLALLASGLLGSRANESGRKLEAWFLVVASAFAALPILIMNPNQARGAAVDWDVFAFGAVPLSILIAFFWTRRSEWSPNIRLLLSASVATGFFTAGSFVAVNAVEESALKRLADLATAAEWSPHARGLAFETLAIHRRDSGRFGEAADLYEKALEQRPGNVRLMRIKAGVLSWAGRHRESADTYLLAVAAEPGYPQVWLNLGMELERAGVIDSAMVAYRTALQFDSTSVASMNRLARLLLRSDETRADAYGWIERSLRLQPDQDQAPRMREILASGPR